MHNLLNFVYLFYHFHFRSLLGAKERRYLKDLLGSVINETVNDDDERGTMNIETDPIKVRFSVPLLVFFPSPMQ
jgi:hypothetical protein